MLDTELERCLEPERLPALLLGGARSVLLPRGVDALGFGEGLSRAPKALHDRRFSLEEWDASSLSRDFCSIASLRSWIKKQIKKQTAFKPLKKAYWSKYGTDSINLS